MTKHTPSEDFENAAAIEALEQLGALQQRSVEIQEEDLAKRIVADKKAADDKLTNDEATRGNYDIEYRKAGRAIREQTLNVSGAFIKTFAMPPQQNPNETLMNTVAMARGLIALWDATKDRSDIKEKSDKFESLIKAEKDGEQNLRIIPGANGPGGTA